MIQNELAVCPVASMAKKRRSPRKHTPPPANPELWPHPTVPHGYRYYFHRKHHGGGSPTDACWHPSITRQEEFTIFEISAQLDLSDARGNLYNVSRAADGGIRELGIFHEQIARFWKPVASEPWHGHPLWPVVTDLPTNRGSQAYRPDTSVFSKLVEQRVLSERDSHRLRSGKNI